MNYPEVVGEFETIRKVLAGYSLARFGDGELKIMHGKGYVREPSNTELTEELSAVFKVPNQRCLIGIPTMDPAGPKFENWTRHLDRFLEVLQEGQTYYSAFVSRPDSAPWINVHAYGDLVEQIWRGKRATVVCEKSGSMFGTVKQAASVTRHVRCPRYQAFSVIDAIELAVMETDPEVVIMSAGPTASCLANRLAARGIHAVDLGSAGGFLRKVTA